MTGKITMSQEPAKMLTSRLFFGSFRSLADFKDAVPESIGFPNGAPIGEIHMESVTRHHAVVETK